MELRFANETGSPMEAVFKFLTTNEVMYAFEVKVAGKVIKGVCKEKEEARREYDDAIGTAGANNLIRIRKVMIFVSQLILLFVCSFGKGCLFGRGEHDPSAQVL